MRNFIIRALLFLCFILIVLIALDGTQPSASPPQLHMLTEIEYQQLKHAAASPLPGAFAPTGGTSYRLFASIGSTNTSVTLSSFREPVSNIKYTMSYLGSDIEYGTLSPQSSVSEFISFTGITQNSDGTAVLTGVSRGLSRTTGVVGCIASSTLAQPHSGQSIFILSNPPCFYSEYITNRNNQTVTGRLNFTLAPTSVTPTTSAQVATKGYVDGVAVSGAPNADESTKGIVELATSLEAASSTSVGGTGARLVASTATATDTPTSVCNATPCQVWTKFGGHTIRQTFIDLTESYTWTGAHFFNNATTTIGNSSTLVIASSTPVYGPKLDVGGRSVFTGGVSIGAASTTIPDGWLRVSGLATTSRLITSTPCAGCVGSTTWAVATQATASNNGDTSGATATCPGGKIAISGGVISSDAFHPIIESYPSGTIGQSWIGKVVCDTGIGVCGTGNMTVYAICITP